MLKVVTAEEMQEIDGKTINKYGIAGTVLMERAGLAVAEKINELFFIKSEVRSQKSEVKQRTTINGERRTVVILCGGGNNGGDGFVAARILHNQGKEVKIFLAAKPDDLKGDARINYNAAVKFGVKIFPIKDFFSRHLSLVTRHCLIVDALFGTGLSKPVKGELVEIINFINISSASVTPKSESRNPNFSVVSIDIPSGISSDTGQVMGCAVKAQHTVTFGLPKRGHLLYPGVEYTGRLCIEDIGFPKTLLASDRIRVNLVEKADAVKFMPERPKYSHKGTYGHVLLIAGSKGKTGAAFMAARSCLRTGAGLVTIGVPESLTGIFQSRVTEEMILSLADKGDGTLSYRAADSIIKFLKKRADVLAVGPGISADDEISKLIALLIAESNAPIVIDADGLNAVAGKTGVLGKSRAPVILTPHAGEMARLLSRKSEVRSQKSETVKDSGQVAAGFSLRNEVEKDRIGTAVSFAKKTKTYLVLKGVPTVTATPEGDVFVNSTGNPGMATAGTGDVLTGMISAFLAQGLSPQNASILGVYMHGVTGDIIAEKKGEHSLIASDIVNAIPGVFKMLKKW